MTNLQINSLVTLLVAALLAATAGYLPWMNVALMIGFSACLFAGFYSPLKTTHWRHLLWLLALLSGFALALYRPAGFSYPLVWQPGALYAGGEPFALYLNLSKGFAGYVLLLFLLPVFASVKKTDSVRSALISLGAVALVLLSGLLLLGLNWHLKWPQGVWVFFVVNLLVTVISEEAFFRLLLQRYISDLLKPFRFGPWLALFLVSILFALAHVPAVNFAFVAFLIAGFAYGAVYLMTGRFSLAVATHFLLNASHILLLEYPLTLAS